MEASKSEEKIYYVSSKSRITAILLCCLGFLGLGGFHRLYVKKWMTGLLYLMTFGLFFLGTAYDLHQLIVERFKDTDGFPLYSDGSIEPRSLLQASHKASSIGFVGFIVFFAIYLLFSFRLQNYSFTMQVFFIPQDYRLLSPFSSSGVLSHSALFVTYAYAHDTLGDNLNMMSPWDQCERQR